MLARPVQFLAQLVEGAETHDRRVHHRIGRDHPRGDSVLVCLAAGQRAPGQDEIGGDGAPAQRSQPLGTALPGDNTDSGLGQCKARILCRDDQVAVQCEFEATADRVTAHGGDDRLRGPANRVEIVEPSGEHGVDGA